LFYASLHYLNVINVQGLPQASEKLKKLITLCITKTVKIAKTVLNQIKVYRYQIMLKLLSIR